MGMKSYNRYISYDAGKVDECSLSRALKTSNQSELICFNKGITMKTIACCHTPAQVMLVDDEPLFLKSLGLKLRRNRAIISFESSLNAAITLEQTAPEETLFSRMADYSEETEREKRDINFDVSKLHQMIYDTNRFNVLAILITDYTMPGLHGVDLAKKAPEHCKRILLTGDADEKTAVAAFNEAIINRYIKKDALNITEMVTQAIEELELNFYHEMSDEIVTHLRQDKDHPLECFDDIGFNQFVQKYFYKYKIVEHYLLDARGSLLALDSAGNYYVIAVRDADDMQSSIEMAEMADEEVSDKIIAAVTAKKKLLYTGSQHDFSLTPAEWGDHLFRVDYVNDANSFYAAFIKNPPIELDQHRIVSFDDYLKQFYS